LVGFHRNPKNTESRNAREIERGITKGTDGCTRFELLFLNLRFRSIRSPGCLSLTLSLSRSFSLGGNKEKRKRDGGAGKRKEGGEEKNDKGPPLVSGIFAK